MEVFVFSVVSVDDISSSKVFLRLRDGSSVSSGMVANFFRTCFSAGRRIGLLPHVSKVNSLIKRLYMYLRNMSIPESMHSWTLLSSAKAVNATIGAE